ncbi:FHA domain-containing protein [Aliikangiella coralliicola]|uniref:FHA domain-containing protein n=1 Tax=Aliikangiella coralliicola TaxID=2592383 RepID=A0A545UHB6_9GAMM|nr:FHA domain-containing protein [Aliikangiella coralliicola]TQV88864.1 FHA domain-containing protein [Aliikangiella coralliicola]
MAYLALIVEDVVINKWEISDEVVILGRAKDCDIVIDDQSVSSKHARLVVESDPYMDGVEVVYLEDLKSTNGTKLNGRGVEREKLVDGDMVKIGFNYFRFVGDGAQGLDETAVIVS